MDFKFDFFKRHHSSPAIDLDSTNCNSNESRSLPKRYNLSDAWGKTCELPVRFYEYSDNSSIRIYKENMVEDCVKTWNSKVDEDQRVVEALSSGHDVIPGVLEGGFTAWTGTRLLLNFLVDEAVEFTGKRVLDLGCGAGILGIYALLHCAPVVTFQDYNRCVIEAWTIPNVKLQSVTEEQQIDFWAGDWEDLAHVWRTRNEKFNIILTAETVYRGSLYPKLIALLEAVSAPDCRIYLASKFVYYGNDGSLESFCDFLDQTRVFSYKRIQLKSENICYGCLIMTKIRQEEQ